MFRLVQPADQWRSSCYETRTRLTSAFCEVHSPTQSDEYSYVVVQSPSTVRYTKAPYHIVFYRAMHYSTKRGLAIACHPSVCLSVTLLDQVHMDWKSWKLIARTISLTRSLFVQPKGHPPTPRGTWGNFGGLQVGWGKKTLLSLSLVRLERHSYTLCFKKTGTLFVFAIILRVVDRS